MIVEFNKLPKKALRRLDAIKKVVNNSDDKLYVIISVDYNTGMIRFESLQNDGVFINLYSTSFTVTIEIHENGYKTKQHHYKRSPEKCVESIFNNPIKFIEKSIFN